MIRDMVSRKEMVSGREQGLSCDIFDSCRTSFTMADSWVGTSDVVDYVAMSP